MNNGHGMDELPSPQANGTLPPPHLLPSMAPPGYPSPSFPASESAFHPYHTQMGLPPHLKTVSIREMTMKVAVDISTVESEYQRQLHTAQQVGPHPSPPHLQRWSNITLIQKIYTLEQEMQVHSLCVRCKSAAVGPPSLSLQRPTH